MGTSTRPKRTPPASQNGSADNEPKRLAIEDFDSLDLPEEVVEIPELGGTVKLRGFTKKQQQQIREASRGPDGTIDGSRLEMEMLARGIIEPPVSIEDVERIAEKAPAGVLDRLVVKLVDMSGTGDQVAAVRAAEARFRDA